MARESEIGLTVVARPGEPVERLIRRFTKKVRADGILQELFLRRHFEKPSVKRRRKSSKARHERSRENPE